ncbi:BTB/POZ domain-containing protein 2 [Chionoecetes opilio]|uniref:BTB/POZ domain-containing protein 2 n=1 Tax=Chionoecetes opilio TaxID=41210 RepID=A0A8J4YC33_CHIOP|nr:BTB/POZ domain-containing protein 2 [Chionoecetes opilio]
MSAPSRKSVSSRKGMKLKSLSLQEKVQVLARMDAVSELVLWDALIKWTTQECARQTLEVNPENQRKVLGDCFNMSYRVEHGSHTHGSRGQWVGTWAGHRLLVGGHVPTRPTRSYATGL